VTVGKKTAEGKMELVTRSKSSSEDVAIADIAEALRNRVQGYAAGDR
jgi:hypothetical protein